jgi:hypothetical protein
MKPVNIDGVNFNAAHYTAKGKTEGVKALAADHKENEHTNGMDFGKVYDKLEEAVKKEKEADAAEKTK